MIKNTFYLFIAQTVALVSPGIACTCWSGVTCSMSIPFILPSNKVSIHHHMWAEVAVEYHLPVLRVWGLIQAVISYNFFLIERSCCQKTNWYSVQPQCFSSQSSQGWHLPPKRCEFWRCLMRSERTHLCHFLSSSKATEPSRAHERLVHLVVFCWLLFTV